MIFVILAMMSKLLMIDDNQMDHFIMKKMLIKQHLNSVNEHSMDAKASINLIEKNQRYPEKLPDIILLDLRMPEFNGWDFLKKFKKFHNRINKKIDVIIVSSSIDPHDRLKSEEFPFVKDFITKPITLDQLSNLYAKYSIS